MNITVKLHESVTETHCHKCPFVGTDEGLYCLAHPKHLSLDSDRRSCLRLPDCVANAEATEEVRGLAAAQLATATKDSLNRGDSSAHAECVSQRRRLGL